MTKYIIGAVVGALLVLGVYANAKMLVNIDTWEANKIELYGFTCDSAFPTTTCMRYFDF